MILIEDRSREKEEENLDGYGLIFDIWALQFIMVLDTKLLRI
jgi:hypothetical protein